MGHLNSFLKTILIRQCFVTECIYFQQSGAFVIAKCDMNNGDTEPTLWRIDGKALLQKYLPVKEDGKTLYKSTSTVG